MAVFGADHVYRMDMMQMVDQHRQAGAGVTVAAIPVPRDEASGFGVIKTGPDGRRGNGGRPPLRTPGDTPRYSTAARSAMSLATRKRLAAQTSK